MPRLPSHIIHQILRISHRPLSTASTNLKPYFVTTPIFYVNASPHIGHLHSILLTDVLSRFSQLREPTRPVLFSTGTDEHGLKIQKAASPNDPLQFCDTISQRFKDLAKISGIGNTDFIRTTEERHKCAVKYFWERLVEGGWVYKGKHEGWYAVSDECFYTEGQVEDKIDSATGNTQKVAIESGSVVEWTEEENYKFKLSEFRQPLIDWLERCPKAVHPPSLHASLLQSLQSTPLQDLSISRPRSRLQWGIPVPGDEDNHTIYVWVDALINYLTVTGYPWVGEAGTAELASGKAQTEVERGLARGWPADVQVVGKDIVRFHAIYWPALLLALNLPLPTQILSHSHWTQNHSKMSKSRGNVVDPMVVMQDGEGLVGREGVRWYLMRSGGSLERDADYSEDQLKVHYNLLASQIGNLLGRISSPKLLSRFLELPTDNSATNVSQSAEDGESDAAINLQLQLSWMRSMFEKRMEDREVTKALEGVMEVVAEANKLFTHLTPWKPTTSPDTLRLSLTLVHESLRRAAILLFIVMPEKMAQLLDRLGVPETKRCWADVGRELPEQDEVMRSVAGMVLRKKEGGKGEGVLFPPLMDD